MDYGTRRSTALADMEGAGIDALLVTKMTNIRYLTGFTGTIAYLILARRPIIAVDFRYHEQARRQAVGVEVLESLSSRTLWPDTRSRLSGLGSRRVGVEAGHLTLAQFRELEGIAGIEWVPTDGVVERRRWKKDADELKALREAVRIADEVVEEMIDVIKPGMTEHRVAGEIELRQRDKGGERSASEIIVASGSRSSMPHGIATDRVIRAAEPVMLDLGTVVDGYLSDLTRTIHLGKAPDGFRKIYEIVFEAQRRAEAEIRPGMTCREADSIARDYIGAAGYGDHFGHSLGHSIGLDNHERPGLSPFDDAVLEPGVVTTVEPGIYLGGKYGVRLEDMIVVTDGGCEVLSSSRKGLVEV
jgi:Xaa-Pro aminopeptidase